VESRSALSQFKQKISGQSNQQQKTQHPIGQNIENKNNHNNLTVAI
jgi:hypothetical protein